MLALQGVIFLGMLAVGFVFGYTASDGSMGFGLLGLAGGFMAYCLGAFSAGVGMQMNINKRAKEAVNAMERFKAATKSVMDQRGDLAVRASIALSRASVERVVQRILSHHTVFIANPEQMEAAIEEARVIIDEELQALQDAVKDESAKAS